MFEFASAVLKRLSGTRFSLPVLLITFTAYIAFGYAAGAQTEEDIFFWLIGPALILMIAIEFLLSRKIGHAGEDEKGTVAGWFGWSMLSAIPPVTCMLLVALPFGKGFDSFGTEFSLSETLAFIVGSALAMSLSALSVGRAIKAGGLNPGVVATYFRHHFGPVFIASLVLLAMPQLLSDLFLFNLTLDNPSQPVIVIFGILYAFLMLVVRILIIAIGAEIYRSAEAAKLSKPTP